jgi:hypothetical protein
MMREFLFNPILLSGNFVVEWFSGLIADEVSIDVVNMMGQKVFSSSEKILCLLQEGN